MKDKIDKHPFLSCSSFVICNNCHYVSTKEKGKIFYIENYSLQHIKCVVIFILKIEWHFQMYYKINNSILYLRFSDSDLFLFFYFYVCIHFSGYERSSWARGVLTEEMRVSDPLPYLGYWHTKFVQIIIIIIFLIVIFQFFGKQPPYLKMLSTLLSWAGILK